MKNLKEIDEMIRREIWDINENSESFDLKQFNSLNSFAARKRYADQTLSKIASGSARHVYRTPDGKVLKLAKNKKGIAQNELECELGNDYYVADRVTEVFECDDNFLWLVAEYAQKISPNRFKELTGVSINDVGSYLRNRYSENNPRKRYGKINQPNEEELHNNEFLSGINDIMMNYDMPSGDLGRISSYGEVIKDGEPDVVLTDYGLNDNVYSTHYTRIGETFKDYFGDELNEVQFQFDDFLNNAAENGHIKDGGYASSASIPQSVSESLDDYSNISMSELKKSIDFINNYDESIEINISILYKNYLINSQNINVALKLTRDEVSYFDNLMNIQRKLKGIGLLKEDLVYWGVDDATKDEYKLGGEGLNEDNDEVKAIEDNKCAKYFDLNSILNYVEFDKPLYSIIVKRKTAKFYYMSPKQYMYKIASNFGGLSYEDTLLHVNDEKVNKYAELMKSGSKAPVGYFRRNNSAQEGRHRALAAMKLGCDSIPIIEFIDISNKQFDTIINKLKDKSFEEIDELFKRMGFTNGISQLGFNDLNRYVEYNLNENLNEEVTGFEKSSGDKIANYVAKKLYNTTPKFIGEGAFGYAYDIGDKVIKVTTDKSEAVDSINIKGKDNKHIANIYDVFHTDVKKKSGSESVYVIVLEKLQTPEEIEDIYYSLDEILDNYTDRQGIPSILVDEYIHNRYVWDKEVGDEVLNYVLKDHPKERKFLEGLMAIADEAKVNGMSSMDFINPTNLGYKRDGTLAFFDAGFCDYYKEPNTPISKMNIGENVQQMEKKYIKTGSFTDEDKENVLSITNGDNYTRLIADLYAWLHQIKPYDRGGERRDNSDFDKYNKREILNIYKQLKNYNKNVFQIKDFDPVNSNEHPIDLWGALRRRGEIINLFNKIPSVYLRNLKNEIRKPINIDHYDNYLINETGKISNFLKQIERLTEDKKNIILKKVFSSKNDTFEKLINHIDSTDVLFLNHDDDIESLIEKVNDYKQYGEAEVLYYDNNIVVIDVKSSDAMKGLGCGSQWCFATEYDNLQWQNYANNSHVNIVYNFNKNPESRNRMVVVLPSGDVYNMYNEYMPIDSESIDGWEYLEKIGASDHVNVNLVTDESHRKKTSIIEEVLPYYEDMDLDDIDDEIDIYEISDQAHELAKRENVGILRDKELSGYIIEKDKVIGALFTSIDGDEYSFDVVVDKNYQSQGYGRELIDYALSLYKEYKEIYGNNNLKIKLDVINPNMRNLLKKYYGFKDINNTGVNRYSMGLDEDGTSLYNNAQGTVDSGDMAWDLQEMVLDSLGNIITERILSWMPKAKAVKVKDKCKLGGNVDGTSTACNQGDIDALEIEDINDDNSNRRKDNTTNIAEEVIRENTDANYRKWKRNNVTYRGISDDAVDGVNGGMAMLGQGLYSVPASNKAMAKKYGKLVLLVGAIPKNAKIFNTLNDWEIWFQNNVIYPISKSKGKDYLDSRDVNSISKEMMKLGYDGIIIKGREMVNYKPEDVKYYYNERQLEQHYDFYVENHMSTSESINERIFTRGEFSEISKQIKKEGFLTFDDLDEMDNENEDYDIINYGALMIYYELEGWDRLISKIKEEDLYDDGSGKFGREYEPHTTILYGFHDEVKEEDFYPIIEKHATNLELKGTKISLFENEKFDVVKIEIEPTEELLALRNAVMKLPHTLTYKDFKPHMTLAYVKSGMGKKYVMDFKGKHLKLKSDKLVFSTKDMNKTEFNLNESRMTFSTSDYKDISDNELLNFKFKTEKYIRQVYLKKYLSEEDIDDILHYYMTFRVNYTRIMSLFGSDSALKLLDFLSKTLQSRGVLSKVNENNDYVKNLIVDVVKKNNIHTIESNGKTYVSLWHGTTPANHKKILKSGKLFGGTYLAKDQKTARRFGLVTISKGEPVVMNVFVDLDNLFYDGNYFTLQRDANEISGGLYENTILGEDHTSKKKLTIYHGTKPKFINDIKQNGLVDKNGYNQGWYMVSTDFESALFHAHPDEENGNVNVVEFSIPISENDRWEGYPYLWDGERMNDNSTWYALMKPLPSNFIVKIHNVDYNKWKNQKNNGYSKVSDNQNENISYISSMIKETNIISLKDLPFKDTIQKMGGKIYSVGGAVRDEFLGKESKDLDILITGIPMDKLEQILSNFGRVDAVGQSFGILKFKPQGATEDIDVAIPRTEVATGGGGHKGFDVTSDHNLSIEDDLKRRDFTINAIAKDMDGNLIDPFGGQKDLANKKIKLVNAEAFSDDPLRMLRAIGFAARFDFDIDPKTEFMIKSNASRIKEIAGERILEEFNKVVNKNGDKRFAANLLKRTGIFKEIFGSDIDKSVIDRSPFEEVSTLGEFIFLLTRQLSNPADVFRTKLKGDINTAKEIEALSYGFDNITDNRIKNRVVVHNMFTKSPNSINSVILPKQLRMAADDLISGKYPKNIKELDINGNDLMNLGLKGKEVGDSLKNLLVKVFSDKLKNNKKDLLNSLSIEN